MAQTPAHHAPCEVAATIAVRHHDGLPVAPIRWVLIRNRPERFEPQALLCIGPARGPAQNVGWFVRRWQLAVTVQEARAHPGVETRRRWSDTTIARTTPYLPASFSIVTLAPREAPCPRTKAGVRRHRFITKLEPCDV